MSQRKQRFNVITFVYQCELLNKKISYDDAYTNMDLTSQELKMIKWIDLKYDALKFAIVSKLKKNWTWERLQPLERAILLVGALELMFREKKIVINEMVEISKTYILGDKYKFINYILDQLDIKNEKDKKIN